MLLRGGQIKKRKGKQRKNLLQVLTKSHAWRYNKSKKPNSLLKGECEMLNLTAMPDGFAILDKMTGAIDATAAKLHIKAMILYIVGVALALVIGVLGYRLIKLVLSAGLAYFGYLVGLELFTYLGTKFADLPSFLAYVCGGIFAVLFFVAAFLRFSYALYSVLCALGAYLVVFYTGGTWLLGLGGGILFALIAIFFVRASFVLISSFVGGVCCIGFLGKLLPDVAILQLGANATAFYIALGAVLVFALLQFLTTRRPKVGA
jgi:hypothetical protein